ncbi:DUF6403 family protein [Actinoplanes sp. N902-109]|uniref:DUF6403 family protein n=1 Tax=Actinoplanes sp. (strain N902-109) TaxID=649831 RepID=UPI0003294A2C|nr:DUF6403 family protein [Actinoplanes sp. N902-109]AGL18868.1 hypothetical protein L083_5358 [Actinoplanes sp. N902-109]
MWGVWVAGAVVLVAAGAGGVVVPRLRGAAGRRRSERAEARAAMAMAAVSREACAGFVPEAEQLLARAEALAAGRNHRRATAFARRADEMWRAHAQ